MANMQKEIYTAMAKNLRTSKEYADFYMETVYGYDKVASKHALKNIVPTDVINNLIDAKKVIEKSNEIANETHMAGNPIYNFEYIKEQKKDAYNRAKTKKQTQKEINDYFEEDEDVDTF